ncbi:adenylate/guanylate cyclase domain-containing protein [Spirulina major CS-329]|uniref:response regulator n=1 Tax=Spirulina TaxID=1154 RepID=UPI00232A7CFF|nr:MULTISPECIES: adenylate/guanylate cyclase domain-containing protein [Spirulina]MDB9502105.1 adenylate/guanylate cyclase domain-containing protein [Spirulina major CS-329]
MGNPQSPQKNIIIVDDTPANLRLLSAMLGEQGYRVRSVTNGAMAINAAQAKPPDLILLDINMPKMNGYEVCRRLKESELTAEIPVIFLSALDDVQDKITAFHAGGVDYVTKPFHFEEVLVRVRNQLALRQAQEDVAQKSIALESFSYALRALHRLNTTDYESFPGRFRDYLQTGCELLGTQWGGITKIQANYYSLVAAIPELSSEDSPWHAIAFPTDLDKTYCHQVITQRQTVMYSDAAALPETEPPIGSPWRFHAYLGTPIWAGDAIYGTLYFADGESRSQPFAIHEVEIIELMAQSLGRAIADYQSSESRRRAELAFRLEKQKSEKLLLNILPQKIARRLKQAQTSLAEEFPAATVLMMRVVGVNDWSQDLKPAQIVQVLHDVFTLCDRTLEQFGLEAIKAVGTVCLVVGGVPVAREDHLEAIADVALALQGALAQFTVPDELAALPVPLQIRMGMQTGNVMAGVIGTKRHDYDFWGEAVDDAMALETQCPTNQIHVSARVYEQLRDRYQFAPGESDKSDRAALTYYLLGKQGI